MNEKILDIKNLNITFNTHRGTVKAARGINFFVNKGEKLAIVGESGSGKSVIANSIMRLVQKSENIVMTGSILFENEELITKNENEMQSIRGRKVGIVFQDPISSLNPTMRIGHQIAEAIILHKKLSKKEAYKQALEMLGMVGISYPELRFNQYPHQLSGGMRQRVMIAIALSCQPQLLLADEPTTALDVTVQAQILDLLLDLKNRLNMSIILITHDLSLVANFADRIVVIYAGKVMEEGNVHDIFNNPQHPYTCGLIKSAPGLAENAKGKNLYSIDGYPPDLYQDIIGCPFFERCEHAMNICKRAFPECHVTESDQKSYCWLNSKQCLNCNRCR